MHRAGLPLRPTSRLTSAEAGADRGAINLRCSVLGARPTLGAGTHAVKRYAFENYAICDRSRFFVGNYHNETRGTKNTRIGMRVAFGSRKRKCTESVVPSSDPPTDFRRSERLLESHQPRTLRARCTRESRGFASGRQGYAGEETCNLR